MVYFYTRQQLTFDGSACSVAAYVEVAAGRRLSEADALNANESCSTDFC